MDHYAAVKMAIRVSAGSIDGHGRRGGPKGHAEPVVSKPHQTGRNDPCRCGSGKKFKRCCMN
jgi:hypothetical protein